MVEGESVAVAYSEVKKQQDIDLLNMNKLISNDMKEVYKETNIAKQCQEALANQIEALSLKRVESQ